MLIMQSRNFHNFKTALTFATFDAFTFCLQFFPKYSISNGKKMKKLSLRIIKKKSTKRENIERRQLETLSKSAQFILVILFIRHWQVYKIDNLFFITKILTDYRSLSSDYMESYDIPHTRWIVQECVTTDLMIV